MGRFITEDPIKDGNNWYAYCMNNPLTFIDPTGLLYQGIGVSGATNAGYDNNTGAYNGGNGNGSGNKDSWQRKNEISQKAEKDLHNQQIWKDYTEIAKDHIEKMKAIKEYGYERYIDGLVLGGIDSTEASPDPAPIKNTTATPTQAEIAPDNSSTPESTPNLIENVIHKKDHDKVELGSTYNDTSSFWSYNEGNKHLANDIKAIRDSDGKQDNGIRIVSPYDKATIVHINESSNSTGGNAVLLIKQNKDGEWTDQGMYLGHVKDFAKTTSWSTVTKGEIIATMGSTGSLVSPVGFIHTHAELRNQSDWNDISTRKRVKHQGGLILK